MEVSRPVRPGVTWFDSTHFLNRSIPLFRVKDGRMWAAMDAAHRALGGDRVRRTRFGRPGRRKATASFQSVAG